MKFILNLDMPATVAQVEEFCAQVRRVHEAHGEPVDDVLLKTWSSDEDYDTGGTQIVADFERAL